MAQLANTSLLTDGNLVAYHKLEDTSDSKGSYTLTDHGTVPFNSGKFGNAADGGASNSTKYLTNATNLGIAGNGAFSISFWLNLTTDVASGLYILMQFNSTLTADRYLQLNYNYNGGSQNLQVDAGGSGSNIQWTHTIGTAAWHHLVVTRAASDGTVKLYFDDVMQASGAAGTVNGAADSVSLLAGTGGAGKVSGLIDDVGWFSKVLSQAEVDTLFNPASAAARSFLMRQAVNRASTY